jgi:hypothetical protein
MKIEGSGSGSISQRHGSADPDLDPHQNVMDPQHCPEPNQTKPNQHLLENGISFPNPDRIHPFDIMDCIVKAILY